MRIRSLRRALAAGLLAAALATTTAAFGGGGTPIVRWSLMAFGGGYSSGGSGNAYISPYYEIAGTAAQSAVGRQSAGGYSLDGGVWGSGPSTLSYDYFFPLVWR